jgi:hypothetical protein
MKKLMAALAALLFLATLASPAQARHHHYKTSYHHSSSRGACDGFHRCRCGTTQAAHFGLPLNYRGHNLKLAAEWGRAFPRTGFHAGAVGVRPHHVLRVIQVTGPSTAIVADDAGTYERNVSGFAFVSVTGGGDNSTYSARSHHRYKHHRYTQQVAYTDYQPVDRFAIY